MDAAMPIVKENHQGQQRPEEVLRVGLDVRLYGASA